MNYKEIYDAEMARYKEDPLRQIDEEINKINAEIAGRVKLSRNQFHLCEGGRMQYRILMVRHGEWPIEIHNGKAERDRVCSPTNIKEMTPIFVELVKLAAKHQHDLDCEHISQMANVDPLNMAVRYGGAPVPDSDVR